MKKNKPKRPVSVLKDTKRCNKCGLERPLVFFSRDSASKDGFHTLCKWCKKGYEIPEKPLLDKMAEMERRFSEMETKYKMARKLWAELLACVRGCK